MRTTFVREKKSRSEERGFALLDVLVGIAIMSGMLLVLMSSPWHGSDDPHQAALALQLAMSEARGLAMTNGSLNPDAPPTGATVLIATEPNDANESVLTVYASRPIVNPNPAALLANIGTNMMTPEVGRPPVIVRGHFEVLEGETVAADDFAITVGASGAVNFAPGFHAGDAVRPSLMDCAPGASVAVVIGSRSERHPIACQDGVYDSNASQQPGEVRAGAAP